MGVQLDFAQWGPQWLAAGEDQVWWYTWSFDSNHWSRMSALPTWDSPPGSSIQILEEWTTGGTLWVHWKNNGTATVTFQAMAIIAPQIF